MDLVFDIETDGLDPTKIHVLSWEDELGKIQHTHDYVAMRIFFEEATILIGHNIVRYDIPAVEKILGVKVSCYASGHSSCILVHQSH